MKQHKKIWPLTLGAIGIVYGDIGTSPLYALRESLNTLTLTENNILGILSLIFWSLILVISIKYITLILRADNKGEGGTLALLALFNKSDLKSYQLFFALAIIGTALLIGDGMITPAISVLSAIEGLEVALPQFSHLILPLTFIILTGLFLSQHHGAAKIGSYFGPILLIWFIAIAWLGAVKIFEHPVILKAVNPFYAVHFFSQNGWKGFALLGSVFLVVTGGEALYADLGQFGKRPIRLGWFLVALPCLLLNYFGQGAHLLQHPEAITNPFYALAPDWFASPLLLLATVATVIASEAVISATFSLTKQAVMLDLCPKVTIVQTSKEEQGQVYVPQMNLILALGTLLLVGTFKSSSALAHAYGIAVNLVMLIGTVLISYVAHKKWNWSLLKTFSVFSVFLTIDLAFLASNGQKLMTGGWVPIVIAAMGALIMLTWHKGITYLRGTYYKERMNVQEVVDQLKNIKINYVPNSLAIFITDPYDNSGGNVLHYLKLNQIMPEHALIVSIVVENQPYTHLEHRYAVTQLSPNIFRLKLHMGFMQLVNIPDVLTVAIKRELLPFLLDTTQAFYLVENTNIVSKRQKALFHFFWQEQLFASLMRSSVLDIDFFHLPHDKTIIIGCYCEI